MCDEIYGMGGSIVEQWKFSNAMECQLFFDKFCKLGKFYLLVLVTCEHDG